MIVGITNNAHTGMPPQIPSQLSHTAPPVISPTDIILVHLHQHTRHKWAVIVAVHTTHRVTPKEVPTKINTFPITMDKDHGITILLEDRDKDKDATTTNRIGMQEEIVVPGKGIKKTRKFVYINFYQIFIKSTF